MSKYLPNFLKVSQRVAGVEYAIRDIVQAARAVQERGVRIDYLNIGDPVQFGFQPPQNVVQALVDAIQKGENYYAPSEGIPELRRAIASKESSKGLAVSADDVIVTNGVSEALDMVISSIVEEGDEVLLPGPYYPPYASYVRLRGGTPVEFAVDMNTSAVDIDDLTSKITPKTVAICLISPNNPSGVVFDRASLKAVANIASDRGIYLICDEIYDYITYDTEFVGIGRVAGSAPVIILNGFSKAHLMTGWRVGYVAFNGASPELAAIRENLPKLARVRIASNTAVQYAALESLRGPQNYIAEFVSEVQRRRDYLISRLNDMPGISCSMPGGAFYAFPKIEDCEQKYGSDKNFVMSLLEKKGVLTVHGSGFGQKYGSGHFRIVYLPEIDTLRSAMDKLESFVSFNSR